MKTLSTFLFAITVFLSLSAFTPYTEPTPLFAESDNPQPPDALTLTAQWGRGSIVRVAYAPNGKYFFVGSASGVGVYEVRGSIRLAGWIPFHAFEGMMVSEDGNFLRLANSTTVVVYDLTEQKIVEMTPENVIWNDLLISIEGNYGNLKMFSPDGALEFTGQYTCVWVEEYDGCSSEETTRERIIEQATGKLLYERYDPVPRITYSQHTSPQGCDLKYFGYCGNAFLPVANTPFRAAFAPDGMTFAVLYRPPNLWQTNRFSVLRVYRTLDGKLLTALGSYGYPVEDFAYAPDSRTLVAGFVDGSVQVWDLGQNKLLQTMMHFDAPIQYVEYSSDGKVLVIKHTNTIAIRMTRDGSLRARFEATTFALSPATNILALAQKDGTIRMLNLNTWQELHTMNAHAGTIFSLAFSPDGTVLASSGEDCALKMWDVETGKFLHLNEPTVVDAYGEGFTASRIFIYHLEFIPETTQLLGFGSWGTTVSWNTHSGARQYVLESAPLEYYNGMKTLNPHFPEFFGVDQANDLFYINEIGYHLNDGTFSGRYQAPAGLPEGCYQAGPVARNGMRFTRGYDAYEGQICVLDNDTLELIQLIPVLPASENGALSALGWLYLSPDGEQLLATTRNGVIYVFEVGK